MNNVYVKQFFNEGFGRFLYLIPCNYIKKKIKNKTIVKILITITTIIYSIMMLFFIKIIFELTYPF